MNISQFHTDLLTWYQENQRDLPWRQTKDPYSIWISEIMLQQTQVQTVIPYYLRFLERFPTVKKLAEADLNEVLKLWEGLGYYSRARNLHKASRVVLETYQGTLPQSVSDIKKLPGIGDYTTAAILSIAFDQAVPAVDGNIKRVFARLRTMTEPVNEPKALKSFKSIAQELMNTTSPSQYNQALMELGALICKPQNPLCEKCPVSNHCLAFKNETVRQFPVTLKKNKVPVHQIAIGVVQKEDKLLITQRKPSGLLGGLWEFPGGKIEPNEDPREACLREIKEETGLTVEIEDHLTTVRHAYTHFKIEMEIYLCHHLGGEVELAGPVDFDWINLDQIDDYAFPAANHKFIPLLKPKN